MKARAAAYPQPDLARHRIARLGLSGHHRRVNFAMQTMLSLVLLMAVAWPTSAGAREPRFDPAYASIEELRAALDSGRVSSTQLVRYYLGRIDRLDKRGPHLNALISLNPKALEDAQRFDAQGKLQAHKSALYGIPFIAKDNYDSAGIPTSGGSAALRNSVPARNAFIVQKLLDQGAILLGKANMSELAASYGRLGYSSAGGLTLNPYNTARDASGSSSGSAVAVAADYAPFALGTDTTGSIRGPASVTGVVGMRPTMGLISRNGIIPLSLTFDTVGVLARNVRDVATVLDAIAGEDSQDASTVGQPRISGTYLDALPTGALRGVRLGVIGNFQGGNSEVDAMEQSALRELKAQGAVLVPITLPKEFERLWTAVMGPIGEAEFKPQFERYLRSLPAAQPKTLTQFIDICTSPEVQESATPVNPARLEALRAANVTELTDSAVYIHLLAQVIPSIRQQLQSLITENQLSAFVFSTMSCPATPRYDHEDPSYVCHSDDPYKTSYIAAAAGFPEISVPIGRISANMPVGYSLMGPPFSEAELLGLAHALQMGISHPAHPPLR